MKNKNFDIWLSIGLNILHYRKEQGMTQMQLAEKCNISRTYMQKIETASCSCTLDTLIDIAEALNIPLKNYLNLKTEKTAKVYIINCGKLLPFLLFFFQSPCGTRKKQIVVRSELKCDILKTKNKKRRKNELFKTTHNIL